MSDIFVSKSKKETDKRKENQKKEEVDTPKKITSRNGAFSSFCYRPQKIKFETQEKKEEVVLLLRKHFVTNIKWILIFLLMIFSPLLFSQFPLLSFLPSEFMTVIILAWYMVSLAFALEKFLSWYYNVQIITDERIVDIDFYNLIYKEVSDANIDKIQDVTYRMGGVVRTLFDYGDVIVQTASEDPNLDFLAVPYPAQVAKILQDLRVEEEVEKLEGRVR